MVWYTWCTYRIVHNDQTFRACFSWLFVDGPAPYKHVVALFFLLYAPVYLFQPSSTVADCLAHHVFIAAFQENCFSSTAVVVSRCLALSLTLPPPFSTWRAMLAYRYSRTRGTSPRRAYDLGSLGLRWFSITAPGPKVVNVLPEPV